MTLRFEGVRVPLAEFELRLDLALEGPVTAVVGPSGAGKTSLLELVAGLRRPAAGRLLLDDSVFADAAGAWLPPRERELGYLTQDDTLFPHLSVERNLAYGARGALERAARIVSELGLAPLGRRAPRELSGGERRRVALARALLRAPRLLLLDEPLTGLNPELRARVLALLASERAEGTPMLYVTHVAEEAAGLADEVVELRAGSVVRAGPA